MAAYSKPNLINVVWASGGDRVAPDIAKYNTGWLAEIPPRQYFNFIDWKQDQWAAYSNQIGIPEWDSETEYQAGKSVVQGTDGNIYQAVATTTGTDPVVDTASRWRRVAVEDAPSNGRQYVRRNHAWQEIDSTAFAPAVHTHPISQINGLQNALNNKLDITGTTPVLNSVGSITLRLTSVENSANSITGRVGTTDNWSVGKASASSDNVGIRSFTLGTSLFLRENDVFVNKDLYVNSDLVFHQGNLNPSIYAPISGPTFTGTPRAPTPPKGDVSTRVATTSFVADNGVPSRAILMWSGSVSDIPSGWTLCDGTGGTPNLQDRFILGAGSTYNVGATGGSKDAVLVSHNHGGATGTQSHNHTHTGTTNANNRGHTHTGTTNAAGNHTHSYELSQAFDEGRDPGNYIGWGQNRHLRTRSGKINSAGNHSHSFGTNSESQNHSHTFTTGNNSQNHTHTVNAQGESGTNKNMPPYYALCFIMKL